MGCERFLSTSVAGNVSCSVGCSRRLLSKPVSGFLLSDCFWKESEVFLTNGDELKASLVKSVFDGRLALSETFSCDSVERKFKTDEHNTLNLQPFDFLNHLYSAVYRNKKNAKTFVMIIQFKILVPDDFLGSKLGVDM